MLKLSKSESRSIAKKRTINDFKSMSKNELINPIILQKINAKNF